MTVTVRTDIAPGRDTPQPRSAQLRLDALLAVKALEQPDDLAFVDQAGRQDLCDRAPASLSFGAANARVDRLARFLIDLRLAASSPVVVALANGTDACLAVLACQRAGVRPCLVSPGWERPELVEAVAMIGAEAIITEARVGSLRPADTLCEVAANFFGLRFLCAFGSDVPDGVIALDAILAEGPDGPAVTGFGCPSLVTFDRATSRLLPVGHDADALVTAALPLAVVARIGPGSRVVSLLAPDDLAGLATGLALTLATGAALHPHGVFDSGDLVDALQAGVPAHLVVPAWFEAPLNAAGIVTADHLASLILVHRPPLSLTKAEPAPVPVIDPNGLGEAAFAAMARDDSGRPTLGRDTALVIPAAGPAPLTALRVRPSGIMEVRGRGTACVALGPLQRPGDQGLDAQGWRATRFRATLLEGRIIAIKDIEAPG